jgi:hypothetical protein
VATANDEVDRVAFFYGDFLGYQYVINTRTLTRICKQPIQGRSHQVSIIRIPQAETDGDIVTAAIIRGHGGSA